MVLRYERSGDNSSWLYKDHVLLLYYTIFLSFLFVAFCQQTEITIVNSYYYLIQNQPLFFPRDLDRLPYSYQAI